MTLLYLLHITSNIDLQVLDEYNLKQYILILDSNGAILARYGDMHTRILYDEIPTTIHNALLATEDVYFWHHSGVNLGSMARAIFENTLSARIVKGGSTITQQLAKNILFSIDSSMNKRKTERKVKEFLLAFRLENLLSKQKILEYYLNRVYFGRGAYGITAAARTYLNKTPEELTQFEASFLIGLIQAPSRYAQDYEKALKRARHVMQRLFKVKLITQEELDKSMSLDIGIIETISKVKAAGFTDWIITQIPQWIRESGKSIIVETTLDSDLQARSVALLPQIAQKSRFNFTELAFIGCERNGAVKVMIGGLKNSKYGFNRVTQSMRQAGSAFKIYIYLAGFILGLTLDELIDDTPPTIGDWTPSNYFHNEIGFVSVTRAFAESINSATIRIAMRFGLNNIINTARLLGLTGPIPNDCSLILGSGSINLYQLAQTFLIISNYGRYITPYGIIQIKNHSDNEVIWRQLEDVVPIQVINNDEAFDKMLHVMEEVVRSGTGRAAKSSYIVGGKTGTSQDYRDIWFGCVSPFMVACAWAGNDDNSPMNRSDEANLANPTVVLCKKILDLASNQYHLD